jgi:hypothetical protein
MRARTRSFFVAAIGFVGLSSACSDDDGGYGTQADQIGVGAECRNDADCLQTGDGGIVQQCLTEFKGGYCGLKACQADEECPYGSACVSHEDGQTYCFRICRDKGECNLNRSVDHESNCVSSVDFVEGANGSKACVPPSSG